MQLDSAARNWLADTGYDPVYGARPLKRMIQTHLQNPRATMVLEGTIQDDETVQVSASDDGLTLKGAHNGFFSGDCPRPNGPL